jgi:phosphoglycerate dehydrogenase-like enzyme
MSTISTGTKPSLLVTGSDFLLGRWEADLEAHFAVTRVPELALSEDELIRWLDVTGAAGYVLGGVERVTEKVFQASPNLRFLVFTGTAIEEFVPGIQYAWTKGIRLAATRGANTNAVAESTLWIIGSLLARLSAGMPVPSVVGQELEGSSVVIIGRGRIGKSVGRKLSALGANVEFITPETSPMDRTRLLGSAHVLAVCASTSRGEVVLSSNDVESLTPGTIVVNTAFPSAIDLLSLERRVRAGDILLGMDFDPGWSDPPAGVVYSKFQTAWQKGPSIDRVNERAYAAAMSFLGGFPSVDEVLPEMSAKE